MHEKVLLNKKNGMAVMLLSVLFYAAAIVGFVFGCILVESGPSALSLVLLIVCAIWLLIGWIPFLGLKVLKPQEALVLTLFGKYVGTLKNDGFYLCQPLLHRRQSRGQNQAQPKRRCRWRHRKIHPARRPGRCECGVGQ